jgi:hypothetical protein
MQTITTTPKFDILSFLKGFSFQETPDLFSYSTAGRPTTIDDVEIEGKEYPKFTNEFWTSKQRQASSLHEISYRACFKPQLPRFFIEMLTEEGDTVYDPFSGRGTTAIEAGLLNRNVIANDINPLSKTLALPRFFVPTLTELKARLEEVPIVPDGRADIDLSMFFHGETLEEIVSLRKYLADQAANGWEDHLDLWIRMVATNRLTGHSPGFFSVYTLPPNQAVSPESQIKINEKRRQTPEYRDTKKIILKKTKDFLRTVTRQQIETLGKVGEQALFLTRDARHTPEIPDGVVQLTVTSPPFLDVVQYADDNWLRCWFNSIDVEAVASKITVSKMLEDWSSAMSPVFVELYRITRPGGWVAFEVGEIRSGRIRLDEHVVPLGVKAGFGCEGILINQQEFTKTANIWGIRNNSRGTNTNRVVIFYRP